MTRAGLVIWHRMSSTQDRNVHASLNPAQFCELSSRLQVCRMRGLLSFILLDTWMIWLRYIHISTWVPSVSDPVTDVRSCPFAPSAAGFICMLEHHKCHSTTTCACTKHIRTASFECMMQLSVYGVHAAATQQTHSSVTMRCILHIAGAQCIPCIEAKHPLCTVVFLCSSSIGTSCCHGSLW